MAKDNLFYSEAEKILFWVPGYDYSQTDVDGFILWLKEKKKEFIEMGAKGVIKSLVIDESRRYKYMRYFWCEEIEPEDVPEAAFCITNENGWTMWKWLRD